MTERLYSFYGEREGQRPLIGTFTADEIGTLYAGIGLFLNEQARYGNIKLSFQTSDGEVRIVALTMEPAVGLSKRYGKHNRQNSTI